MVIRIKKGPLTDSSIRSVEAQMDWDEIRKAKVRCEHQCALFDHLLGGGCSLGLLPSLRCKEFKRAIRKRGGSSAAERLFANEEATGSNPVSRSTRTLVLGSVSEAKELCGDCSSLVCVDGEWWCEEFNCSIVRIVRCLKWKEATDKASSV